MVKHIGYYDALAKWNDLLRLRRMPRQRTFADEIVDTPIEVKKARKFLLEQNRMKNERKKQRMRQNYED